MTALKNLLFTFFLVGFGCSSIKRKTEARNEMFLDLDKNVSISHPESPFVADPSNSAWEIFLYIGLGILFFCILPSLLVYICERWKPFWCVDPDNKKDLTKEEE